ncbi:MAG TPA: InlB B-repeat-containing protein [Acidimicrobiales bacterium]|nr:InlB B-repeat-containing protein [Acidimicrobiales bacterium]
MRAVTLICVALLLFAAAVVSAPRASADPGVITQQAPYGNTTTVTVDSSSSFSDQLIATDDFNDPVTYTQGSSTNIDLSVNGTGQVLVSGTLATGSYTVTGTTSDAHLDSGTFSYTLTVSASSITQQPPNGNTTTVVASNNFSDQLNASGNNGGDVTYTQSSSTNPDLSVNSTGQVLVAGTLATGNDTVLGTLSDPDGDTGSFNYTLAVTGTTITQTSPTSGTTTTDASNNFNPGSITVASNNGSVSFVTTSSSAALHVTGGGAISTTGTLTAGSYTVSGTDSDVYGDTGTWTYTLTVHQSPSGGRVLTQSSAIAGSTTTTASGTFKAAPLTVESASGPVTFTKTSGSPGLTLSGDQIATTGALVAGRYTIAGTDLDGAGDTGTWTYTLIVNDALVQTSATSGTTTTTRSSTFAPGHLVVVNNTGPVTFVTTTSSTALEVTAAGVITTTGPLAAGKYTVSGTDSDPIGNSGTWTYTLTVTRVAVTVTVTVTFRANGGTGSMAAERRDAPAALSSNHFRRTGYTFVKWNTTSRGSGTSYANRATYRFAKSVTLYAQWKINKSNTRAVTFNANGGTGSMAIEHDNTPTALSSNRFTRAKYTFVDWNMAANGFGRNYANRATYPFTASVTLYAQWRALPAAPTVTFNAHGGNGAMARERHRTPEGLTHNRFTRSGFTFVDWNTHANGSGAHYANGATYPFTTSVTLYAQWHHKIVPKPAIHATVTIGPFATKSSTLTASLEGEVQNLARTVQTDRDKTIVLVGYGDQLSAADQLNESLWAANFTLSKRRASAVEAFLVQRLRALGVRGFTVNAKGNGSPTPGHTGSTNQSKTALVIAALT